MNIYDITQEVFSCDVYQGDPSPKKETLSSIKNGDLYNLTAFSMCAHNGTHIDAPYHFFENGKTVDALPLYKTVGVAYIAEHNGTLTAKDAERILNKAAIANPDSAKRILLKGKAVVTAESAEVFSKAKIDLLGNESQTVGPEDAPMEVHKILLSAEVVLLEGIRLSKVPEGVYFLNAAPLFLAGADGAPCRAILIEMQNLLDK